MGVTGLWKLIEPCGKPVPVETLEGKILAVDISIWLHQVVKGFQDNKGSALNNAHLLGLFHRLCKLLYYRVRPVFVFDGCVPQLKRDTIARRQQQRSKLNNEADRIQALLLQSLAKEKVVQQALGTNAELLLKSPVKKPTKATRSENAMDELFKLPELPAPVGDNSHNNENDWNDSSYTTDEYASTSATDDSSFDESNPRYAYNSRLQSINVQSEHFQNIPADIRYEILTDIKETRKQSSWGRLHELPSRSDDFSSFQMKRLLKRRAVQESLEQAEQEMGGRSLTYTELKNLFNEEGILTPTMLDEYSTRICSDENTRYLYVRDLRKLEMAEPAIEKKCKPIKEEPEVVVEEPKSEPVRTKVEEILSKDEFGQEYDTDLEMAIAMSLEETQVYNEKDYDYECDQNLKLNREQSKQLRNAAKGPARAYMIEYGGMNEEEVENILEKTQRGDLDETAYFEKLLEMSTMKAQEDTIVTTTDTEEIPTSTSRLKKELSESQKETQLESQELNLRVSDNSDTDSDLEEVTNELPNESSSNQKSLDIVLNVEKSLAPENDIFADIFKVDSNDRKEQIKLDTKAARIEIRESEEYIEIKESEELIEIRESEEFIEIKESEEELIEKINPAIESIEIKHSVNESHIKPLILKPPAADNNKILEILDELKKQTDEIKNIKLESIKVNNSIIEIVDNETDKEASVKTFKATEGVKSEVIEICDSDDNQTQRSVTPIPGKSPKQRTPLKNATITEFFETAYFIKRTPDKPKEEETPPPKVTSPFFVKKTPKSGRKRVGEQDEISSDGSPEKRVSKASKMLFESSDDVPSTTKPDEQEDFHQLQNPEPSQPKPLNAEEVIKEAAEALKSQKTVEELDTLAKELADERKGLEAERNKQDRMGMSISQRMNADCQELLRLFGVPYIVAPMEAEAQCAFLNDVELTNGTITDDSDIWLFGGRTVYKNFFAQNKHVMEFRAEQIEQSFNCDRKKLIQLACLVGSDYTTGVHGIGTVTALEILASFAGVAQDALAKKDDNEQTRNTIQNVMSTLVKFRDWWQAHKNANLPPGSSARLSLRKKLKNIDLHEGFPNISVVEAYLHPKVDCNRDVFSWGIPDVESLREFAKKTFGWTQSKTDDILMPVMKKINDKKTQGSLLNYFSVKGAISVRQLKVSKRVQTAIDKMSGKIDAETPEKPEKSKRTKRTKRKAPASEKAATTEEVVDESEKDSSTTIENTTAKTNKIVLPSTRECPSTSKQRKCVRLPNTKEIIPQRERDLEQMRLNKEKAAAVLKKNSIDTKKRSAKKT